MRQVRATVTGVLACALVWVALVLPTRLHDLTPTALVRVPLEGVLLGLLLLVLPRRPRRVTALVLGLALAIVVLVKSLDIGFSAVLDRSFDRFSDWSYLRLGFSVLDDWVGRGWAVTAVVVLVLVTLVVGALLVPALLRVERVLAEHPRTSRRVLAALAGVWVVAAVTGLQVAGTPVASTATARLVGEHTADVVEEARAGDRFARMVAEDPLAEEALGAELAALRGKDVLLVWVESYGSAALTHPEIAPGVVEVLDDAEGQLAAAGWSARSGYLTSPTFGGSSWLPHATLQSGVWTDRQEHYDVLLEAARATLTSAFGDAGWRTVFVLPSVSGPWPEGEAFYGFDELLTGPDLGYRGPPVGWGGVPDQYTLAALDRAVLAQTDRPPVMAEVDLVTSHIPWPPAPPLLDWDEIGDGSVLDCLPGCGRDPAEVEGLRNARQRFGETVQYALGSVTSFVATRPDRDLVVVLLGDHQPWAYVTGADPGHDVPVTIIAADQQVLDRVAGWGWTPGLRPGPEAPVWRMDTFRDRFLLAFR